MLIDGDELWRRGRATSSGGAVEATSTPCSDKRRNVRPRSSASFVDSAFGGQEGKVIFRELSRTGKFTATTGSLPTTGSSSLTGVARADPSSMAVSA